MSDTAWGLALLPLWLAACWAWVVYDKPHHHVQRFLEWWRDQ